MHSKARQTVIGIGTGADDAAGLHEATHQIFYFLVTFTRVV